MNSDIFVVHSRTKYQVFIKEILSNHQIDGWIFLGLNSLIPFQLKQNILKNIPKIGIAKILSTAQYKYSDRYVEFMDNHEFKSGKKFWWSSQLAGKNPWLSKFLLRYSQLDVFDTIVKGESGITGKILFVIEESALFESISLNYNLNEFSLVLNSNHPVREKYKHLISGILARVKAIPLEYKKKYYFRKMFGNNIFNPKLVKQQRLLIVPTFIDSRNFISDSYTDSFMGKFLNGDLIGDRVVVILPIVIAGTSQQLKQMNMWLSQNGYQIQLLTELLSSTSALKFCIQSVLDVNRSKIKNEMLGSYDVSALLKREILEEWSGFSLQNHLIEMFTSKLVKNECKIDLIYPFENQIWERFLLKSLRECTLNKTIGVQNAPCPRLSTRYYSSKNTIDHLPLPEIIIATGKVSYENLMQNYGEKIKIIQSNSGRTFVSQHSRINTDNKEKKIMVACSIGFNESIELMLFVISAFSNVTQGFQVCIIPHPHTRNEFYTIFNQNKKPDWIKISTRGYHEELLDSEVVLFDSSTAGLEGLANGLVPVHVSHECSLHVNPNEYDKQITKNIYSEEELIDVLSTPLINPEDFGDISDQYFGSSSKPIEMVVSELLN
jgi:hypothetical protein